MAIKFVTAYNYVYKPRKIDLSAPACKKYNPGQSMSISELLARFERGQRVGVKLHQSNLVPEGDPRENAEDFDTAAPPDLHDVVDVHEYASEIQERKAAYQQRAKSKKETKEITKEGKDDQRKDEPTE